MITLPVRLTVGTSTVEAGEVTLDRGDDVLPAVAALLRAAADTIETPEEATTGGTA